jgi:hypothetical protein
VTGLHACHGPRSGPAPRVECEDGAGEEVLFSSGDGALDGDAGGQPDGAGLLLRDAPCPGWYRIPDGTRDSFAGDQDGVWMS